MKKEIIISQDEKGKTDFVSRGFSKIEVLGLLRMYEQGCSLDLLRIILPEKKPSKKQ